MKKKQAWKVMGAVLAGTLVFSDAVPLRASAAAGTEKSAVQNQNASGTENDTETKTNQAAVYVDLKKGSDTADGTTAETAVKTVEKAQELLMAAAAEAQADQSAAEEIGIAAAKKAEQAADAAVEKYLVFVGMDEKELEDYKKKQQKTDFRGRVTDTVFQSDEIVVTEAGYEAALAAEKAKEALSGTPSLAPGESPAPDASDDAVIPTPGPTETPDAEPTTEPTVIPDAEPTVEPTVIPDAEPTVEPTVIPDAEPTTEPTPDAEPTVTPDAKPTEEPTATPTPEPENKENTGDTPTAEPTPDAEPTTTPDSTTTPAPDQKTDDSAGEPTTTPVPDDTSKGDPSETPAAPSEEDNASDQWKKEENLDDLVKDEIQKDNETVKNYEEITKPSDTESTENGYLISNVSLLIQPTATGMARSISAEEETTENLADTETPETQPKSEEEEELLAAAEQKSNLSAGEMVASAADDISVQRTAGTILVGPDNYGTNKTATPTPTAAASGNNSSNNGSSSGSNTGSTKIPQKKTQTTTSIRSIPVNTGDETMVLPLAISSALSAAVMLCMAFLQMQAKRARSLAAWLEFKKNHPFDEE